MEISVEGIGSLEKNVNVNGKVDMLKEKNNMKKLISKEVEREVKEWINKVVDRSIKIEIKNCEKIVKKDFELDYDE
jgi:hypothetical protein